MFTNRALQVQVVKKTDRTAADETPAASIDADQIAQIAMYHAEHAAKIVVAALFARKILNTTCEIAVIAAYAKLNK